jgi:flagellin
LPIDIGNYFPFFVYSPSNRKNLLNHSITILEGLFLPGLKEKELRIGTNSNSSLAQRRLKQIARKEESASFKMSSGSRIYQAADDPAGLAISEQLKAKIRSNRMAKRNANDSVSLFQVVEGNLNVVHGMASRLRELALQAANDTVANTEREMANKEFQNLKEEMNRLVSSASFSGNNILKGGGIYDLQIGTGSVDNVHRLRVNLKKSLDPVKSFGLNSISVRSKLDSQKALAPLMSLIDTVSHSRAEIGSYMNRMESSITNLDLDNEETNRTNSKIRDVDFAIQTSVSVREGIKKQATTALLAQSNATPKGVLKLLE